MNPAQPVAFERCGDSRVVLAPRSRARAWSTSSSSSHLPGEWPRSSSCLHSRSPTRCEHWFRAWALTDGQLTTDSEGMLTLPGAMARTADLYTRLVGGPGGALGLPISLEGQAGLLAAALFLDVKPGYWALILLVHLITPSQLGSRLR